MNELERAAYSNFDDTAELYDDDTALNYAGQMKQPSGRIKSNFDLTITNPSGEDLIIELFNDLRSFAKIYNPNYLNSATVLLKPQTTFEGLAAGVTQAGVVGFLANGDLKLTGAAGVTALTVSCAQYPYRALMESSGRRPFIVKGARMTFSNDSQIDQELVHFRSTFLGAKSENGITPRTFFNPTQNQNLIVDVQMNFAIDDQKGIRYKVLAGNTVKMNVLIER